MLDSICGLRLPRFAPKGTERQKQRVITLRFWKEKTSQGTFQSIYASSEKFENSRTRDSPEDRFHPLACDLPKKKTRFSKDLQASQASQASNADRQKERKEGLRSKKKALCAFISSSSEIYIKGQERLG